MRNRKLALRREVLTDLSLDDLASVHGADAATVPVTGCVTVMSDKLHCDSVLRPCITYTCTR